MKVLTEYRDCSDISHAGFEKSPGLQTITYGVRATTNSNGLNVRATTKASLWGSQRPQISTAAAPFQRAAIALLPISECIHKWESEAPATRSCLHLAMQSQQLRKMTEVYSVMVRICSGLWFVGLGEGTDDHITMAS